MGDENEGNAGFGLQALQLDLHLLAELQVEGGQGFIEQQHLRPIGQGAGKRHALLLAAGHLIDLPPLEPVEFHEAEHFGHPAPDLVPGDALHLEAEGDILPHRHMGEQGIGLEYRVDRPAEGRQMLDPLAVEEDFPFGRLLEPRDQAEQGGLAAAGRPEQGEEFIPLDGDRHMVERDGPAGEGFDDLPRLNRRRSRAYAITQDHPSWALRLVRFRPLSRLKG